MQTVVLQPPLTSFETTLAGPGAGNEWSYTCPANVILRAIAIQYVFTTDANAANRYCGLQLTTPGSNVLNIPMATSQIASTVKAIVWHIDCEPQNAGAIGNQSLRLPAQLWLYPGSIIGSQTANIQAGDAYTVLILEFHQYLSDLT